MTFGSMIFSMIQVCKLHDTFFSIEFTHNSSTEPFDCMHTVHTHTTTLCGNHYPLQWKLGIFGNCCVGKFSWYSSAIVVLAGFPDISDHASLQWNKNTSLRFLNFTSFNLHIIISKAWFHFPPTRHHSGKLEGLPQGFLDNLVIFKRNYYETPQVTVFMPFFSRLFLCLHVFSWLTTTTDFAMTVVPDMQQEDQMMETTTDESSSTVGRLEEEARKRKERLQQLKKTASDQEDGASTMTASVLPTWVDNWHDDFR